MKSIRLSGHAKEQIFFRGTTEEEVIETIQTSEWQPAELGRLECKKDFLFENEWNKRYYKIQTSEWQPAELVRLECKKDFLFENEWNKRYYKVKQVRPIFAEEEAEIVVVTVYTYYF